MKICIDALSSSKNKVSNTTKKSSGESFGSIFNKVIINQNANSPKISSPQVSDVSSIEKLNETFKEELDQRADAALERLAGFFGVGKHLMAAILQYLHIDPKDLLDPDKKKDIVKALTKQFGLDKDNSEALSNLVSDFQK